MFVGRTFWWVVSGTVVVTLALPAAQAKRAIVADDLMKLRSIVEVQIAPDGQRVALEREPFRRASTLFRVGCSADL
jgi:hypothetical protein